MLNSDKLASISSLFQGEKTILLFICLNWVLLAACRIFHCGLVALQHVGSQFSNQGLNPHLLRWKPDSLTTEPPGKFVTSFLKCAVEFSLLELRIFSTIFIIDIGLQFSCSRFGFVIRIMLTSQNEFRNIPLSSVFWMSLVLTFL